MKTVKFKSRYAMKDIDVTYRVCCIHASLEDNFGIFCLGAAIILRSIFPVLQRGNDPLALINVETSLAAVTTDILMEGFEGAQRDISTAVAAGRDNEEMSANIKRIVKEVRRKREEKAKEEDAKI